MGEGPYGMTLGSVTKWEKVPLRREKKKEKR